ncbi:hypothetical protein AMELA_G00098100 [Ameiurus melas]|uniref:Uncharacterized protein n=1 Tax=Ameiurus melas TaxID=219545 RepID=A0A7J6ASU5_AMEME|nr:hypothetical protein AMELA_G00098100 [Ameiurus melas]
MSPPLVWNRYFLGAGLGRPLHTLCKSNLCKFALKQRGSRKRTTFPICPGCLWLIAQAAFHYPNDNSTAATRPNTPKGHGVSEKKNLYCVLFMFYFWWKGKTSGIDAANEDGSSGRLVNDDHKHPNCSMTETETGLGVARLWRRTLLRAMARRNSSHQSTPFLDHNTASGSSATEQVVTSTLKKRKAWEINEAHAVERPMKTFIMSCPWEVGLYILKIETGKVSNSMSTSTL